MRVAVLASGVLVLVIGTLVYFRPVPQAVFDRVPQAVLDRLPQGVMDRVQQMLHLTPPPPAALPPPPPAVPVVVATARAGEVPIYLSGIGTVQAYNTVNIKTQVDGRISRIQFTEGQDVKAGDILAVIDPRPYQAQLQQQIGNRVKDQAMLQGAQLDLTRYVGLMNKGFASQQQVDEQQATVGQYQGAVLNDAAQIDYAQTQLGFTNITSPIDGRVGIRQMDAGNFIRAGDGTTIVVVTQLKPISVVFTVAADAVARAELGVGIVHVPVIALGQDDSTELDHGTVELVDNEVDPATGTLKLKASFPNTTLKLWPGNFVNGRLIVATRHDGITVPSAAVRHGPRCDYAWVVRPDHTVRDPCVTVGQVSDGRTLIEKGLQAGAEVVIDGQYRLESGSRVEIRPARAAAATAD